MFNLDQPTSTISSPNMGLHRLPDTSRWHKLNGNVGEMINERNMRNTFHLMHNPHKWEPLGIFRKYGGNPHESGDESVVGFSRDTGPATAARVKLAPTTGSAYTTQALAQNLTSPALVLVRHASTSHVYDPPTFCIGTSGMEVVKEDSR